MATNQSPEIVEKEVFSLKGKTFVNISLNDVLLTINEKSICKIFELNNSDKEEPEVVDTCESIAAFTPIFKSPTTNKWAFCLADKIQDNVYLYTHNENIAMATPKTIFRSFLDIRDICIVHNGKILAVASDDLEVKLLSLEDILKDDNGVTTGSMSPSGTTKKSQAIKVSKPVVNISFSHISNILAISCNDGSISLWSLSSDSPRLVHGGDDSEEQLSNYVTPNYTLGLDEDDHDDEDEPTDGIQSATRIADKLDEVSTSRVAFGDNNGVFACCDNMTISTFAISNVRKKVKSFTHDNKIKDFKYCGNDNYLCLIDYSDRLLLWHIASETLVFNKLITKDENKLTNVAWKKSTTNSNNFNVYCGTKNGNVVFIENILSPNNVSVLSTKTADKSDSGNYGLFVNDSDNEDVDDLDEVNQRKQKLNDTISRGNELFNDEAEEDDKDNNEKHGPLSGKRRAHFDDYDDLDEELKNLNNDSFADDLDENDDQEDDGEMSDGQEDSDDGGSLFNDYSGRPRKRVHFGPTSESLKPWSSAGTEFHLSDRRYLTMNSIGYAWTVKSSNTQSVTVSFFDRSTYREYYFEDYNMSDVCSLGEKGILLANSKKGEIAFRSHSTDSNKWSKTIPLQKKEIITSAALTNKKCFIGTSLGNFYELNVFGYIINIERLSPVAAMVAYQSRVFIVHRSAAASFGNEFLTFSLFDDKTYFQREFILPIKKFMKNIFFTQYGDPAIFTNDNTLLLLSKWRDSKKSRWVPVLDVGFEIWRLSGGNQTSNDIHCWPLGIAGNYNNTLNYIMLKGSKKYPEFPLPLPTDMEIKIPIFNKPLFEEVKKQKDLEDKVRKEEGNGADGDENEDDDLASIAYGTKELEIPQEINAEEEFLRSKISHTMLQDTLENDGELFGDEQTTLDQLNTIYDKSLLRMFAIACSDSDIKRAYSLVIELKQDRAFGAATKIAERAELIQLAEKINQLREARSEHEMDLL
ncbi:hypothetical protein ACO0QE_000156 [Hanseniaspora vineae]